MRRLEKIPLLGFAVEVMGIASFLFLFQHQAMLFLPALLAVVLFFVLFGWAPRHGLTQKGEAAALTVVMVGAVFYYLQSEDYFIAAAMYLAYAQIPHRLTRCKTGYQGLLWSFLSLVMVTRFVSELIFFIFLTLYLIVLMSYLMALGRSQWFPGGTMTFRRIPWSLKSAGLLLLFFSVFSLSALGFLVTPRLSVSSHLQTRGQERSIGFSELTDLGTVGKLSQSGDLALRLQSPRPFLLRGMVFDSFTGRIWRSRYTSARGHRRFMNKNSQELAEIAKTSTIHEVRVVPIRNFGRTVFAPANPLAILAENAGYFVDLHGALHPTEDALENREITYLCQDEIQVNAKDPRLQDNFTFPEMSLYLNTQGMTRNAEALTNKIIDEVQGVWPRIQAILTHLQSGYSYTLDVTTSPANPLDHFLFESRSGHCEFFATALTLMLRHAGIPARYVTGFVPHEKNRKGDTYFVLQDDAHAWVEAFVPHYGWIPLDATPEIARARNLEETGATFWQNLKLQWYYHVIAYSQSHRLALGDRLAMAAGQTLMRTRNWAGNDLTTRGKWTVGSLAGLILAVMIWRLQTHCDGRDSGKKGRALRSRLAFYKKYETLLKKRGWTRGPAETQKRFAQRVQTEKTSDLHAFITRCYYAARFGERPLSERDKNKVRNVLETLGKMD